MDDRLVLADRFYVPNHLVTDDLMAAYTSVIGSGDESVRIEGYSVGDTHTAFCRGDLGKLFRLFNAYADQIDDHRAKVPMTSDLEFTGKLFTKKKGRTQQEAMDQWLQYGYGQILAPARFGKTVLLCAIACYLKQKTIIFAHQIDLLNQFYESFMEFTNAKEIEKHSPYPVVGVVKKLKEIKHLDVSLCTYQSFIYEKGMKFLKEYKNAFGAVFVDECHKSNAECYHRVINRLNPFYRGGCSATIERKDELHVIAAEVLGPVTAVGKTEEMNCAVTFINTHYDPGPFAQWTTFENRLVNNADRNDLIIQRIVADAKADRYIIALTNRVAHTYFIASKLNELGIKAEAFNGRCPRDYVLDGARAGEIQVVVAIRRMVLGINVPRWDCLHNLLPSSNKPNYYQEASRIRTPYPGKPRPLIRDYVDACGPAYACKTVRMQVYKKQGFDCQYEQKIMDPKPRRGWKR